MTKNCALCGTPFERTARAQKHCPACRQPKMSGRVPCPVCGALFQRTATGQKYCGDPCRRKASQEWIARYRAAHRKPLASLQCRNPRCRNVFMPTCGQQRYCPQCRRGFRMNRELTCAICGTVFRRSKTGQRYCSPTCSAVAGRAKSRLWERTSSRRKPHLELVCKNERCGKVSLQQHGSQLHCSPRCRMARVMRLYGRRRRARLKREESIEIELKSVGEALS